MSNFSKKKAQMFIITGVTIVILLFVVSQWVQPPTIIDTSQVVLLEETYVMNNIKQEAMLVVRNTETCDDLSFNLDEYKNFVTEYGASKGFNLDFQFEINGVCPGSPTVNFNINLDSTNAKISSSFSETVVITREN